MTTKIKLIPTCIYFKDCYWPLKQQTCHWTCISNEKRLKKGGD